MHDVSPANNENVGTKDPIFHLPGMFWMIRLPNGSFTQGDGGDAAYAAAPSSFTAVSASNPVNGDDNTWHLSLHHQLEFDRFQIFGPGNVTTYLNLDTTYTKLAGAPQHITPQTHDPLSPFNWAGDLFQADAHSTFSFAYADGSFSVKGSVDNANSVEGVIPGHIIHEKNGIYAQ